MAFSETISGIDLKVAGYVNNSQNGNPHETATKQNLGHLASSTEDQESYVNYVNPIWVKLLDALGMDVRYPV
jgi:hypothetical protein